MDVVDPRLVGGVHLTRRRRAGFAAEAVHPHDVAQVSSIQALMDGRYDGDVSLGELVTHGDLGLGTVQHLDGELVVVDGRCWQVRADGSVVEPPPSMATPFAVVCRFTPGPPHPVEGPCGLTELCARLDDLADLDAPVVAVRVDGRFSALTLRSVHRQHPPYPRLTEVVAHQRTWEVAELTGTLVGFRFPTALSGVEVPGYHLHVVADDRRAGGHVVDLVVEEGTALVDGAHDLHLEVPPGVDVLAVERGAAADADLRRVEGR